MSHAVLSIGSNLGDRLAALRGAVDAVRTWMLAVSPVYETAPWGGVEQQDFLNAVVLVADARADAREWLRRGQAAEHAAGRVRDVRWGPRTLDIDVIDVDGVVCTDDELTLPHPRAAERAFVLVPWLAVDPGGRLAGMPVAAHLAALDADEIAGVRLRSDLVLA